MAATLPSAFNFARHLLELNQARGDHPAFIDDRGELSYGELAANVRRFGSALLAEGLVPGDRLLIVMPDRIEWPIAFLGSMYAGLVPVPVNTLLTREDYQYLIEHSGAAGLIVEHELSGKVWEARARAASDSRPIFVSEAADTALPPGALSFAALLRAGDPQFAGAHGSPTDVAFWLYSSGSTGRPKGVVHTHANIYWTAELYAKSVAGFSAKDRVFSAAKLFFAYGLGNALTFPLSVGATSILMAERPTPAAVVARLRRHRATLFCGVPTLYASMLAAEALERPAHLRLCISAGEPLPAELGSRFRQRFGVDILDGLGSTELLHIFLSNRPGQICYGATGKPVEGYLVQLRDEAGNEVVQAGQIGDLWVKGPSAALCYWKDEDKTRHTFQSGWVRTGDKYFKREDGHFVYAGRNDDMLKIGGQFVSPFEVESALMQHPAVLECAVIAVLDAVGIPKSKACVVLKAGHAPSEAVAAELIGFVKARLAPFKRPQQVEFVPDLPKTATGKIQRFRLRERAAGLSP